jgi:hypothetical protein
MSFGHPVPSCTPHRRRRVSRSSAKSADAEPEPVLPDAVEKGIKCEIKDIFYVPVEKEPGKFQWVDERPSDTRKVSARQTKKERETYAIVSYNKREENDDEWATSYIQINNTKVHSALQKILEGYPGLTQHEMAKFSPPYLPFFHRWTEFSQFVDEEADLDVFHYLNLLQNMLRSRLEDTFACWSGVERTGHIAWKNLSLALNPGDLTVYTSGGHRCL